MMEIPLPILPAFTHPGLENIIMIHYNKHVSIKKALAIFTLYLDRR
jgi:hypothetical protein